MKAIKSEMAGTLIELKVKVGDSVQVGQEVALVESMKMEVPLTSSVAGKVKRVAKNAGEFLNDGEVLIELE